MKNKIFLLLFLFFLAETFALLQAMPPKSFMKKATKEVVTTEGRSITNSDDDLSSVKEHGEEEYEIGNKPSIATVTQSSALECLLTFFQERTVPIEQEINNTNKAIAVLADTINTYRNLFYDVYNFKSRGRDSLIVDWIFMIGNAEEALSHIRQTSTETIATERKKDAAKYMYNRIQALLKKNPGEANWWGKAAEFVLIENKQDIAQYIAAMLKKISDFKEKYSSVTNKKQCSYYKKAGKAINDCLSELGKSFNKNEITNAFEKSSIFWKKSAIRLEKNRLTQKKTLAQSSAECAAKYWLKVARSKTEEEALSWKIAAENASNASKCYDQGEPKDKKKEIFKYWYDAAIYKEFAIMAAEKASSTQHENEKALWNEAAKQAEIVIQYSTQIGRQIDSEEGFYGALNAVLKDNSLQSSAGKETDNSRKSVNKKQEEINSMLNMLEAAKQEVQKIYDTIENK